MSNLSRVDHVRIRGWNVCFITILTLFFILINKDGNTQINPYSNIRTHQLYYPYKLKVVDSLTIIPSSINFTIEGKEISVVHRLKNKVIAFDTSNFHNYLNDTIHLFYRVFPVDFEKPYSHLDANKVMIQDIAIPIEADFGHYNNSRQALFSEGLNYNGSFSRGISIGNSQSLVLNSQLNMQIEGDLGNGLKISAAISDDQIPIQPEGNTQILQEFDKVFIKIQKDKNSLVAGDYDLKSLPFYFSKYQKKMKGLKFQNTISNLGSAEIISKASFAIAKGKFVREKIATNEGNQGPYKLRGEGASRYLIVIAGSEKVFMDGKLLKRGEQMDYIIDYNRAEISFTAKNIIDIDKRIVIEYEFRDQTYLRSMYAYQGQIKTKKAVYSIDFFRESDSKSIASNDDIDSLDLAVLQTSGDDLSQSIRSGIIPIVDIEDTHTEYYHIVYDSSAVDSILLYNPVPDKKSYQVFFSNVGLGNGSYAIDKETNANGRVYYFVGHSLGSYEPVKQLIAPQKKQMLSLGAKYRLTKNTFIATELSLSDFDNNRFSELSNDDNKGAAGMIQLKNRTYLDTSKSWSLVSDIRSELIHKNFNSISPYRNVEYSRDWNLSDISTKTQEMVHHGKIMLKHLNDFQLSYGLNTFQRQNIYEGTKQEWNLNMHNKIGGVAINGSYLSSENIIEKTKFLRPNFHLYFNLFKDWKLGSRYEHEGLNVSEINQISLKSSSHSFKKYYFYLLNEGIENFTFKLNINRRIDQKVKNGLMSLAYQADELRLNGTYQNSEGKSERKIRLNWDIAFRNLKVIDPNLTTVKAGKNLLSNVSMHYKAFKNALRSNSSYQIGVGQEPKLEYTYEEVQAGEGNFVWLDYNKDGIEQIDEFENAIYQDTANYIKIPIFNDQFITTNKIAFTQNLRLEPTHYIGDSSRYKFLKKWSSNASIRYQQKQTLNSGNSLVPFFHANLEDTLVFSHRGAINSTIFYNRGNPKFDFQMGQISFNSKIAQIYGFELLKNNQYFIRNRINVWSATDWINKYTYGKKNRTSEKFENRNYDILSHLVHSTISYRPKPSLRLNVSVEYDIRKNGLEGQLTKAISKKMILAINYKINKKSSVISNFNYVNVSYDGQKNTPLHNVMLDGLNNGNNYIWTVQYTQELRKNLFLFVRYNGRKTGDVDTIHAGSAQVKASF